MAKTKHHASMRFVVHRGEPCLESRVRAVDETADKPIPRGKILVLRTSLLTKGTDDMETELIDDDGSAEARCRECAAQGRDLDDRPWMASAEAAFADARKSGRNDPCPCGSGR